MTLTLTTEAANNVQSVIAAVADLLKLACPASFDVHQTLQHASSCTCPSAASATNPLSAVFPSTLPANRALSVYKVGREASISIQSLIDTEPRICRHCSLSLPAASLLKKRLNELPSHLRDATLHGEPFVYFCHEQCFNAFVTNAQQSPMVSAQIKSEPTDTPTSQCVPVKREPDEAAIEVRDSSYQITASNRLLQAMDSKRWKRWDPSLLPPPVVHPPDLTEIAQLMADIRIPSALDAEQDTRACVFCHAIGDLPSDGPGRCVSTPGMLLCQSNLCSLDCSISMWVDGAI